MEGKRIRAVVIDDAGYMRKAITKILQTDPQIEVVGYGRTTTSKEVANDLRRDLKTKVFETIVPRNSRLAEVPKRGNPAVLFDVSTVGARAYLNLAKEILEKV